jgi:hypothetical protein
VKYYQMPLPELSSVVLVVFSNYYMSETISCHLNLSHFSINMGTIEILFESPFLPNILCFISSTAKPLSPPFKPSLVPCIFQE